MNLDLYYPKCTIEWSQGNGYYDSVVIDKWSVSFEDIVTALDKMGFDPEEEDVWMNISVEGQTDDNEMDLNKKLNEYYKSTKHYISFNLYDMMSLDEWVERYNDDIANAVCNVGSKRLSDYDKRVITALKNNLPEYDVQ